jgi:hypothetical protein
MRDIHSISWDTFALNRETYSLCVVRRFHSISWDISTLFERYIHTISWHKLALYRKTYSLYVVRRFHSVSWDTSTLIQRDIHSISWHTLALYREKRSFYIVRRSLSILRYFYFMSILAVPGHALLWPFPVTDWMILLRSSTSLFFPARIARSPSLSWVFCWRHTIYRDSFPLEC